MFQYNIHQESSIMNSSDLNVEALRRIEATVFDCTIPHDKRIVMIQDTIYQLIEMQSANSPEIEENESRA